MKGLLASYGSPLLVSLVLQLLFLAVGVLAIDGGKFLEIVEFSLLATWVAIIFVILRRTGRPTEIDLWVIQFSFPAILILFGIVLGLT